MRKIERTGSFKRDFKRVKATPRHRDVEAILIPVLQLLMVDQPFSDPPPLGIGGKAAGDAQIARPILLKSQDQ